MKGFCDLCWKIAVDVNVDMFDKILSVVVGQNLHTVLCFVIIFIVRINVGDFLPYIWKFRWPLPRDPGHGTIRPHGRFQYYSVSGWIVFIIRQDIRMRYVTWAFKLAAYILDGKTDNL